MAQHKVVSQDDWLEARKAFLAREKEFTRLRDKLSADRRELPWVKVEKEYIFDGPDGKLSLADLFGDKQQLMIYHFMYGPDWEEGCPSCTFWADNFNGIDVHLAQRDIRFLAISKAELSVLEAYKTRFSWTFDWVSSLHNDFNHDFLVSFNEEEKAKNETFYNYRTQPYFVDELPGVSVFYKDMAGDIFHTYSTYARGLDILNGAYNFMDLAPKGRDEDKENTMSWLRRRDQYE